MSPPDGPKLAYWTARPERDPSSDEQRIRDEAGMHLPV
jgi:hypothetical protein